MSENKEDKRARIRELRLSLNLTTQELADRIGIKQSNMSGIENGGRPLGDKMIFKIISATGVNPEWLNTGNGPMMAGDINVSGNRGTIGAIGTGNTANMTINAWGFQKIIHPDGTVELIPYTHGDKGNPVSIEQIISEYNTLQREKASWENERRRLGKQVDQYQDIVDTLRAQLDKA